MTAELKTTRISCPGGMPAFVVRPDRPGKFPVVVLMHERYGLVEHTEHQAMRCAADGFLVVAGNFFYEHPDQQGLADGSARCDLDDRDAVRLIKAAFDGIKDDPAADMTRTAVAGYCQTGRHPLLYAAEHETSAVVIWYGAAGSKEWAVSDIHPVALEEVIPRVKCPVFGAFGDRDHIISVENVRKLRGLFEDNLISYDIHVYEGAPHGWLNDTMPGRYRREQAEAAWADQQKFLARVLGETGDSESVRWTFSAQVSADYDFSKNKRLE